jgi:hypothetical protein
LAQETLAKGVFGSVIDEITPEFVGEIEISVPKDKAIFEGISTKMKEAQEARDTAINSLLEAVDNLNRLLV